MGSSDERTMDRREFVTNAAQTVGAVALATTGLGACATSPGLTTPYVAPQPAQLPTRMFGKTRVELPTLGYGGAALPERFGNSSSHGEKVNLVRHAHDIGLRYFDTAISFSYGESQAILGEALKDVRDDVFITSKVDFWDESNPDGTITSFDPAATVAAQVEQIRSELGVDYVDAILIHGTPGIEQMTVEQAMGVHAELAVARDKGQVRFIGLSAHHYFDKALQLISTGEFDLCMLAYGYVPRGLFRILSEESQGLRDQCIAKAHELDMGIVAMKVLGAGMLSPFTPDVPAAACRYVLKDERVHMLTIGMQSPNEIDANVATLTGDTTYRPADEALLASASTRVLEHPDVKKMPVE